MKSNTIEDPIWNPLQELCHRQKVTLIIGGHSIYLPEKNQTVNGMVFVDKSEVKLLYAKMHLFCVKLLTGQQVNEADFYSQGLDRPYSNGKVGNLDWQFAMIFVLGNFLLITENLTWM